MRHLLFLLLRLSCCVARNAKFISLKKQRGNKCLIVVMGIHLRRRCLQLSAISCGTQIHITSNSERQKKKKGTPRKQGSSKIPIPIPLYLRACFLMHSFLQELLLLTLWRHPASENHAHSGYLMVFCLPKYPWNKYNPSKPEKGIEHPLQGFLTLFGKMRTNKLLLLKSKDFFWPGFRALWVQQT